MRRIQGLAGRGRALALVALAVGSALPGLQAETFQGDPAGQATAEMPMGPQILTPERSVELALAGHPAIRTAASEVAGAVADRGLARSGYLPRVDLSEAVTRSNNPVFVFGSKLGQERFTAADFALEALNEPEPMTNSATRLVLRQSLWDAGRTRLGSRAATLGVESAEMTGTRAREQVAFAALSAFWDAVMSEEILRVALAAEEAARTNRDLAARQVEAGLAVPSDGMQAAVRFAEVRALRIRAEQNVAVSRAALREALGTRQEVRIDLRPPEVGTELPAEALEDRFDEALAQRADLRAVDLRIRQSMLGEKMARSYRLPEAGLGAQVEWNAHDIYGNDGNNWSVGATLRIPLFDGLETRSRMDKARAGREGLEARRTALVEAILLQVRSAWADRDAAAARLRTTDSALGQAEEALRIVRERYAEGMAVMVELTGAEEARTRAQADRVAARRDVAMAAAALDLASGRPLGGQTPGDS